MDIIDAINKRASIRKYTEDPLDPKVVQQLLESARMAPSANNQQTWRAFPKEEHDLVGLTGR